MARFSPEDISLDPESSRGCWIQFAYLLTLTVATGFCVVSAILAWQSYMLRFGEALNKMIP